MPFLKGGDIDIVSITNTTSLTISSDSTIDVDATDAFSINSSAGAINIGNDAINQNINIGTSGTRTLNIGSVLSTLNIESLDTTIKLGDAAGVRKIYITDSADAEVGSIDSNGKATMTQLTGSGTATEPIISNNPSSLAGSFRSMSLSVLNNRRIAMGLTNACADSGTSTAGADFSIWAYDDNGNFTAQLFQIDRSSRDVSILGTSSSTSSSTGALIVAGGIGITNTTDASSSTNGGTITTAGGLAVAKKAYFGSTTSSTSSSTGALIVTGGIGITNTTDASSSTNGGTITTAGGLAVAKKAYFGDNLSATGNISGGQNWLVQYLFEATNYGASSTDKLHTSGTASVYTTALQMPYNGEIQKMSVLIDSDGAGWSSGTFILQIYANTTLIYTSSAFSTASFTAETSVTPAIYYSSLTDVNQTFSVGDRLSVVYTGSSVTTAGFEFHVALFCTHDG